jgi:hypothetical protein
MGKDMRGQRPSREDYEILEEEALLRGRTVFSVGYFLVWYGEFWWTVTGVHQVAGSFGLGGQESSRNPGAREPDRLCS